MKLMMLGNRLSRWNLRAEASEEVVGLLRVIVDGAASCNALSTIISGHWPTDAITALTGSGFWALLMYLQPAHLPEKIRESADPHFLAQDAERFLNSNTMRINDMTNIRGKICF